MQDRDAGEDEKQFKLSRFMPVLQEVLEDLATNSLPEHEYPYVSAPTSNGGAACCAHHNSRHFPLSPPDASQ